MPNVMTKDGYEKLVKDLSVYKKRRKEIIEAISAARDFGDLSENFEYQAAKNEQSLNEGRIQDLEGKLAGCQIIDMDKISKDRIQLGSTFKVYDLESQKNTVYTLVSADESDTTKGYISNTSPLGRAFMGKQPGDSTSAQTPSGTREFEIEQIL